MANELQNKLDAILEDKNTNLKPENLKKGITLLGVEGIYKTPRSEYVKEFMSEEEMRAAEDTLSNGDICEIFKLETETTKLEDIIPGCKISIPAKLYGEKYGSFAARTLKYSNADNTQYLKIYNSFANTNMKIDAADATGKVISALTCSHDGEGYIISTSGQPLELEFTDTLTITDTSEVIMEFARQIDLLISIKVPASAYEYSSDLGFIPLADFVPPVKKFKSLDEMNNSTRNNNGDIAIIEKPIPVNLEKNRAFSKLIFPQTVVVPEPVDDEYGIKFINVGDGTFNQVLDGYLDMDFFRIYNFTDRHGVEHRIEYAVQGVPELVFEKVNGPDEVEFDTELLFSEDDNYYKWHDYMGMFMQTEDYVIDGIYRYVGNMWIPVKDESADVKNFTSVENMRNSINNKEYDIAVVSTSNATPVEVGDDLNPAYHVNKFTLPEPTPNGTSIYTMTTTFISVYDVVGGTQVTMEISPTHAKVVTNTNIGGTTFIKYEWIYKSSDGQTYSTDNEQFVEEIDAHISMAGINFYGLGTVEKYTGYANYIFAKNTDVTTTFDGIYQYDGTSWNKVQEQADGQILRQYETIEDMQSAEVNQDDLGMVIKPVGENIQQGQVFGGLLIFPKTVTLPDGVTFGFNELTWSSTTSGCRMSFTISTSSMNIHIDLPEEEIIDIDYTTEDGKMYTRITPDTIIDTIVEFTASTWYEAISYFIQTYIKDVVEIHCYGTEGWELVLSSDVPSPETSNMIIEKGKEYVIEFNRTIDENINLADVAASQSLNITGTNGVNIVIGNNYFISYQDLMPAPNAVLIRNYMDASTIQVLKDTFGESDVVVDNTDRGWKETIPHYSSGAAFNLHSIWTPHPITIGIASITENGQELDTLDLSAYSWLIKSVKQN